jgi:hypothetical protein
MVGETGFEPATPWSRTGTRDRPELRYNVQNVRFYQVLESTGVPGFTESAWLCEGVCYPVATRFQGSPFGVRWREECPHCPGRGFPVGRERRDRLRVDWAGRVATPTGLQLNPRDAD